MNCARFSLTVLAFASVCLLGTNAPAQTTDRATLARDIQSLRDQLQAKELEFLSPSAADRAAFAELLHEPETGLIRLLPREKFDGKLMMRGGGAYYSFTKLANDYGYGSDIQLEQNFFSVGFAGADWGYLAKLGDVPLQAVALDHSGVQFLATLEAATRESAARAQHRAGWLPGLTVNGWTYTSRVPAILDTTYVLRSVDYGESDVLVAFRVVRQDADGSLTLLWKMLKKFPTPQLEREASPAANF